MRFEYFRPKSLQEALEFLDQGDERVRVLAGGTDVLVFIQDGIISPRILVDLGGLEELKRIEGKNGRIRLGSMVTHVQASSSLLLRKAAPILVQACAEVGSPQIRSRGTLGGNLTTASPSGDVIPPLFALEAVITLKSRSGDRSVPIEDFFTGVKKTLIRHDELLVDISFPVAEEGARGFFRKLGQRKALAISKVSVAAWLDVRGGKVQSARIALGAVAPTVIRAFKTEASLQGKALTRETIAAAAKAVSAESKAITDIRSNAEYRNEMVGLLLTRGLEELSSAS